MDVVTMKRKTIIGSILCILVLGGLLYALANHVVVLQKHADSNVSQPASSAEPVTSPGPRSEEGALATYGNVRFGYLVDYPSQLLIAGPEADNSDGLKFASKQGDADIRVWGQYNVLDSSPRAALKSDIGDACADQKTAYEVRKPAMFAFSCTSPKGRVIYEKTIIRGDTFVVLYLDYAKEEQEKWAPVIKQMSGSLRFSERFATEPGR
jgi:hypothetical protein